MPDCPTPGFIKAYLAEPAADRRRYYRAVDKEFNPEGPEDVHVLEIAPYLGPKCDLPPEAQICPACSANCAVIVRSVKARTG